MPSEAVLIKELRIEQDKNKRAYTVVIDGYNNRWNLFNPPISMKPELNKAYVFRYETSGEYKNVKTIEPLANVFKQQALKEIANKNDVTKNYSIATSYAVQLVASGKVATDELFTWADKIYEAIAEKANKSLIEEVNGDLQG